MSGITTVEGYPFPLESDFADVQDAFRLATAIDADLRAEQAPFRAFMGRPSFIGRCTANQSGYLSGTQLMPVGAVEWDNTGGLAGNNSPYWLQPNAQPPSWWLVGTTILVNPTGATVAGEMNMGMLQVATTNQVTSLVTTTNYYQRNDDSATNGEWLNVFTMAALYQGQVNAGLILNGTTQKAIENGSRIWGVYLGPVT
jgi:hypothetical protein